VQWLALLDAVVLCSLRHPLERFSQRTGMLIAWFAAVLVTTLGSAVVCRIDQSLALELSVPPGANLRFVLANAAICALIAAAAPLALAAVEVRRVLPPRYKYARS
jgi:two-component system sensor histidine kinase AlgZ